MNQDTNWHRVATIDEIEDDEALPVDVDDVEIALCKVGETVYAINNICSHEYACMSDGFKEGDTIECPLHQSQFHIPTGKVLSPPADRDLQIYPVKVVGNDVYVQVND